MAQQDNTPRKTGTATVTVACKLPHGLLMKVYDWVQVDQLVFGGGIKQVREARPRDQTYRLNGNSVAQNRAPGCEIVGGFALTHGIPKDFWDRWIDQHKDWDAVKNHLIFAHEPADSARAESREKKGLKSGLERLNPKKLPRGIAIADETDGETKKKIDEFEEV
jgi:hypothetical protein